MTIQTKITSAPTALTDKAVERLPLALGGQYVVRDAILRGLFVLVGKRNKSWTVQGDLRRGRERTTIKITLGTIDELSVKEARARGAELLEQIRTGSDPRDPAKRVGAITLRDATETYIKVMERKGRSVRSIWLVRDLTSRILSGWLNE
jgi:Arm DNA-binding domain